MCLVGGRPLCHRLRRHRLRRQGFNGDGRTDRASLQDSVTASVESEGIRPRQSETSSRLFDNGRPLTEELEVRF